MIYFKFFVFGLVIGLTLYLKSLSGMVLVLPILYLVLFSSLMFAVVFLDVVSILGRDIDISLAKGFLLFSLFLLSIFSLLFGYIELIYKVQHVFPILIMLGGFIGVLRINKEIEKEVK